MDWWGAVTPGADIATTAAQPGQDFPVSKIDGASADPATRRALLRTIGFGLAMFFGSIALLLAGFTRFNGAERHQEDLVRDGRAVSGLVLTVDHPIPGIDGATFASPTPQGRRRAHLIVFNTYERGQKVTVYVSKTNPSQATLAGETPQAGFGWIVTAVALLLGLVGVPLGARRLVRAARSWTVLREHPWAEWRVQAIY